MKEFSKQQLDVLERLLHSQRKELVQEADKTIHTMTGQDETFADPADRASWESESDRDLRIRDRERKLLDKIEEALERFGNGTFGECEECGDLISFGRLRARPVTTFCIECKAEQEEAENKANHS